MITSFESIFKYNKFDIFLKIREFFDLIALQISYSQYTRLYIYINEYYCIFDLPQFII